MSDEEKKPTEDKKKKKGDKDAPAAAPPNNSKKTIIGVVAAVAVLSGAGWAIGNFVTKTIAPAPAAEKTAEETGGDPHGGGDANGEKGHGEKGGGAHAAEDGMLAKSVTLDPIELKCNITSTGGTRYATMTVGVWVLQKYVEKIKEFKRPIQDRMEEVLPRYQLEDFNAPNFKARVRTELIKEVERLLESIEPKLLQGTEKFVTWIDITAPLTQ